MIKNTAKNNMFYVWIYWQICASINKKEDCGLGIFGLNINTWNLLSKYWN